MEEIQTNEDTLDEFIQVKVKRRTLLPWWIKVFCWLFMLFGIGALCCIVLGLFNVNTQLSLYGLETNQPFSLIGIIVITLGLFKAFTAYSLFFEKDDAIMLGKIDAIIGIAICSILMIVMPIAVDSMNFTFRIELALLIPYLLRLNKIEKEWVGQ